MSDLIGISSFGGQVVVLVSQTKKKEGNSNDFRINDKGDIMLIKVLVPNMFLTGLVM